MEETVIYNAVVVMRDRVLDRAGVALRGRRIAEISEDPTMPARYPGAELVDAQGDFLLPGFIDTHSDNIENVIQPRPQSTIDFELAMREQEKQLANEGITTIYHSLSTSDVRQRKTVRSPDNIRKLVRLIRTFHEGSHIVRHRFHCRYDVTNLPGYPMLLDFIRHRDMQLLSFTDHTPGQGQYRDIAFFKSRIMSSLQSEEEKDKILAERMKRAKLTTEQLAYAAGLAHEMGIPIASHDDDCAEKLHYVTGELYATISEFPVEMEVAREARRLGMQVSVGATNILMGHSHANNLSALDAIRARCADILVSDYFPPSILHAIFKLYRERILPLNDAVNMATYNPARAVRIERDFGSIEKGKYADLLLVAQKDAMPVVRRVYIDGECVSRLSYRSGSPERAAADENAGAAEAVRYPAARQNRSGQTKHAF